MRQHMAYMLNVLCYRQSVRLSVCHTGLQISQKQLKLWSYGNFAIWQHHPSSFSRVSFIQKL